MKRAGWIGCVFVVAVARLGGAHPGEAPKKDGGPPGVVELLEDDVEGLMGQLFHTDNGSRITRDFRDFYSGVCSVRVTPTQRYNPNVKGWAHAIAEKPGPGQYRYLRFAWKRIGAAGIMIQFHNDVGSWNQRYVGGRRSPLVQGWGPMLTVDDAIPDEWTVVTRDLFKDFGPMRITGVALTPMDGGSAGLFDHFYLGGTIEDLDRATAAAFGKTALREALPRTALEKLWRELADADVNAAARAVRTLTAGRKDSVAFLRERLREPVAPVTDKQILVWIADLDANTFRARETASRELERVGEAAVPLLQKAAEAPGSGEALRRIRELLRKRDAEREGSLPPERARLLRAVRVLEWAGTDEARRVLEELAGATQAGGVPEDARQALARLKRRK
jgi:hypothetical protein